MQETETILITGALGQIGSDLTESLQKIYGKQNIIVSDIKESPSEKFSGIYEPLDAMDFYRTESLIEKYSITTVYHLASLLSGTSEKMPMKAWQLNVDPLIHFLDLAKDKKIKKLFWPSSIAVFGKETPKEKTPQFAVKSPNTVYGMSKVAGENWCNYYYEKYNVDVRSIRYPGLISWKAPAGGGTTDYAVEIFYKALEENHYNCFLEKDSVLPMLYMDDAIAGTIQLMSAPKENIKIRTSYNLGGISFSPEEIFEEIKKNIPDFTIKYTPDFRQKIANSWPYSIDDSYARTDWDWNPKFKLEDICKEMIFHLKEKLHI